ncbi:MAG: hypothetical protein RBU37_16260, partial [Myxococcota bacterium]|nr:hypothetical protein [Myxococcota bacterium]
ELLEQIQDEKPRGEPGTGVLLGQGRPIIEVAAGAALTGRSLDVTVDEGNPLSYSSSIYPVFTFDLLFFPFAIFSSNDYLAGIGIFGDFGYGTLDSAIPVDPSAPVPEACSGSDDPGQVNCSTTHSQFKIGGAYRLLFNSSKDHPDKLDPAGMALTIKAAYQWLVFDVAENTTYEGHGYQGLLFGLEFGMPLGLDELRAEIGVAYTQMLSFGDGTMIANWGESASGFGFSADAAISYDIVAGLFAKLLYDFSYFTTSYGGTGCQNRECTLPTGAAASDMYNQISVQLGWRFY